MRDDRVVGSSVHHAQSRHDTVAGAGHVGTAIAGDHSTAPRCGGGDVEVYGPHRHISKRYPAVMGEYREHGSVVHVWHVAMIRSGDLFNLVLGLCAVIYSFMPANRVRNYRYGVALLMRFAGLILLSIAAASVMLQHSSHGN